MRRCWGCRKPLTGKNRIEIKWFRRSRKYPDVAFERTIKSDKESLTLCETCADKKSPNLWLATKMEATNRNYSPRPPYRRLKS